MDSSPLTFHGFVCTNNPYFATMEGVHSCMLKTTAVKVLDASTWTWRRLAFALLFYYIDLLYSIRSIKNVED
jgi:hypothetical protein